MKIEIHRAKESWHYRRFPSRGPAWTNNDGANSLDLFLLFDDAGEAIFHCKAQTVSNCDGLIPGARYTDTIIAGPFGLKTDVDPRNFRGRIHGIVLATTIAGEGIRSDSTTRTNASRWLLHDWQRHRDQPPGDTRVAWSAGCIVLPTASLAEFNRLLDDYEIKPGTIIPGTIIEEAT
jgi:hypothetical protein